MVGVSKPYAGDLLRHSHFLPVRSINYHLRIKHLYTCFFVSEKNIHQKEYKMLGSFLNRGLVLIFGYAYPAYECYKTVEKNKPNIEHLRFWCQYWILVALLTVGERIGDIFISWVPMYGEAKLAFYIYLWYPKTKGTTFIYESFFRPYISKHETDIDRKLLELRTRAGDFAVSHFQKAASYGQTRVLDIIQYIVFQSMQKPSSTQSTASEQPEAEVSKSSRSSSSSSSGQHQEDTIVESKVVMKTETANAPAEEDAIRVTRGRLRKTQATSIH